MGEIEEGVGSNPSVCLELISSHTVARVGAADEHLEFQTAMCEDVFDTTDGSSIVDPKSDNTLEDLSQTILRFVLESDFAARQLP